MYKYINSILVYQFNFLILFLHPTRCFKIVETSNSESKGAIDHKSQDYYLVKLNVDEYGDDDVTLSSRPYIYYI